MATAAAAAWNHALKVQALPSGLAHPRSAALRQPSGAATARLALSARPGLAESGAWALASRVGLPPQSLLSAAAGAAAAAAVRARRRLRRSAGTGAVAVTGEAQRVAVFGATGYIGKAVVEELAKRGHQVLAVTREKSGIGGQDSTEKVQDLFSQAQGKVEVVTGDVTDEKSVAQVFGAGDEVPESAVCCLASRSGGRQDSFDIDFQATVNCVRAAREAGVKHFILLSAVCVQRPLLAFQEAKLLAEKELMEGAADSKSMSYSIVRPTAFFKSLLGQVKGVKGGAPYVMFGDGTEVRCKPISEEDLGSFIADCLWDPKKRNAVLPIGGPGPAMSFKEQGELLFSLLGREPNFICVPYAVFDVVQGVLDFFASLLPDALSDAAEYGRIGRYYAEQSMLVLDTATGEYSAELTPSYGKTSLRDFLEEALQEGSSKMESQQLGDQSLSSRVGLE